MKNLMLWPSSSSSPFFSGFSETFIGIIPLLLLLTFSLQILPKALQLALLHKILAGFPHPRLIISKHNPYFPNQNKKGRRRERSQIHTHGKGEYVSRRRTTDHEDPGPIIRQEFILGMGLHPYCFGLAAHNLFSFK
ncbi:hypothetical protein MLD38_004762 [Melastoma candidum]|uniref:Uncharacterized protein n=1 Tax=Melastoma candidum TaxID=119954 RepID=A0ACB9S6Q6_9MYRT|nr:hypothetical protein MLD38_004762 [Melastoma candidum]